MENQSFSALAEEVRILRKAVRVLRREVSELKSQKSETSEVVVTPIQYSEDKKIEVKITTMLHELKIPPNIKGFSMLREAVFLVYTDFNLISGVTHILYPMIAKKYNSTPARVERAIRHAIEISWSKAIHHPLHSNFDESKPTNATFIALLAETIRLKNIA